MGPRVSSWTRFRLSLSSRTGIRARCCLRAQNDDDVVSFVRGERSFWSVNMYIGFKKMMMTRDFSLRRIVQNWDDSFENKKKRKWNERKHKEEKTNNARRILKLFSSRGSSSGSLLFLGGVYRGHLIHSCYTRARCCALLCCVLVFFRWFFEKKINLGQKQTKTLNHSILLSFRVGCPIGFFSVGHTHALIFNLNTFQRANNK